MKDLNVYRGREMRFSFILLVLLTISTLQSVNLSHAEAVTIMGVEAPSKVYDNEPFTVKVTLHASDWGRKTRLVLSYMGTELGSAESALLMDPGGSFANLTITDLKLQSMGEPYVLVLDAYWLYLTGTGTKEDSRALTIQAVRLHFTADCSPKTAQSNTTFNVTCQIKNEGNDIAYAVEVELSDLSGLVAASTTRAQLGDIAQGQTRPVTFLLSSGLFDFSEGSRKIVLTLRFRDWEGLTRSHAVETSIFIRVSQGTVTFWFPLIVVLIAVFLFIIFIARSIRLGPLTIRRRS
jgi:hypothetical protein